MGDKKKAKAPELLDGAPADLTDFIDCKAKTYAVKNGKLGWVPGKPTLEIKAGAKPGTFEISLSVMGVGVTLPASVSKGGQLNVDTTKLPDLSTFIEGLSPKVIDKWVRDLNDWFRQNGMKLGAPTVKDGVTTLTKVEIPGAAKAEQPKDGAAPKAPEPPKTPEPKKAGVKEKAGALIGATAIGFGTGFVIAEVTNDSSQPPPAIEQHAGAVKVVPAEDTQGSQPQETKEVAHLPEGPVTGNMQVTGPRSFVTPIEFNQDGGNLTLIVPGNPPFVGTIDDDAKFDVRNDDGSFVGGFNGSRFNARHIFQGVTFDAKGTIDRALAIDETPVATPTPQPTMVDLIVAGDFQGIPAASLESNGSEAAEALLIFGALTFLTGVVLVGVPGGQTEQRNCEEQRDRVKQARLAFERSQKHLLELEDAAKQARQEEQALEEALGEAGASADAAEAKARLKEASANVAFANEAAFDYDEREAEEHRGALLEALQELARCEGSPIPDIIPPDYYPKADPSPAPKAPEEEPPQEFQPRGPGRTDDVM